jgi:hypothetical protein
VLTYQRLDDNSTYSHVLLDIWVVESSTNQSFGIEDGVLWVHGRLVFGGYNVLADSIYSVGKLLTITNQSLAFGESNV